MEVLTYLTVEKEEIAVENNLPIYLQISNYVENEILNGRLKADDKVPSTNEFSKALQINPATAGKGLNELVDKGILYKKRGLGMFVTEEAYDIIQTERKKTFINETVPAFKAEARRLGITDEELKDLFGGGEDA